ncbi:MAG TPA: branched-chain amino acid ABC transporter permease [Anaeromyxobacteraceae bacterium]|nr:branched-chain amino acid ABC transporter permease [Anaeromyxobacteraceae bacterium]
MRRALPVAAALLLLGVPLFVSNQFLLHLGVSVLLWTTLGVAWNLLGGYAGQVSFGHAAFFGVGAYTTMILYLSWGLPPWWGMFLGGAAGAMLALPIGLTCFRLRGPYFSLATLAVAEIVRLVALNWESLTAGPVGLLITALPPVSLLGRAVNWERKEAFFAIAALVAIGAMLAAWGLTRARLGGYLLAIREDEDAAEAVGIDTARSKVAALMASAFLAGVAGGFYGLYYRYVDPDAVFPISLSVEMVFIAVVGGLRTVAGPVVGAVFLTTMAELFRERFTVGHLIFYGLFMMIVIRWLPEGIWGRALRLLPRRLGS